MTPDINLGRLADKFPAADVVTDRLVLRTRKCANGCIEWAGHTAWNGYGRMAIGGRRLGQCHRVAYAAFVGPIPDGMNVLHNCPGGDNRRCVNPSHLWVGTQLQNVADRVRKGRSSRGESHPKSKLTAAQVASIRAEYSRGVKGRTYDDLGAKYGVSGHTIQLIVKRRIWKEVACHV